MAEKEYNYEYDEGKIVRAAECDVEFTGEIITAKIAVNAVKYYYDSEGNVTRKVITPADGKAQTVYYETADDNTVVKFNVPDPENSVRTQTITSHSKNDSFGRKVFDELQLGTDFVSRQFVYHIGKVTEQHKDNAKVKSSATTQLVSQIILSGGRTISYEYDPEERITKVTDSVDGLTEYTYDALGQLLTETVNGELVNSMEYDNYGNIVKKIFIKNNPDTCCQGYFLYFRCSCKKESRRIYIMVCRNIYKKEKVIRQVDIMAFHLDVVFYERINFKREK